MKIIQIIENKKEYMPLLLLGDEQESMIEKYLFRGELYVLFDQELIGVCAVTNEGEGIYEIKNIAVSPDCQGKGYGKMLIHFVEDEYKTKGHTLLVGTGESPLTIPFYEKCGFTYSHRIKNFFIDHYDHPMFEDGQQLVDMVYYKKAL